MKRWLIDLLTALLALLDDDRPVPYRVTQAGREALREAQNG